jgi:hypothetical protein
MDPGTGLAILGGSAAGAQVIGKLLGPTADYVGAGLKNWAEHRVQNVARIFRKASDKLGPEIDNPGAIHPKVLKEVLDEGSYSDDELTAEYFGGILASGRSPNGRDDRAASYLRLTGELSTYQIRFHYIAYTLFRRLNLGSSLRTTFGEDLRKMELFLPYRVLQTAMDFTSEEPGFDILLHCISGLGRHDLIADYTVWGQPEHLNKTGQRNAVAGTTWVEVAEPGVTVSPTQFGIDYYLWAMGSGRTNRSDFLKRELTLTDLPEVNIPDGAALCRKQVG